MQAESRKSILIIEDSDKFRSTILLLLSEDYNVIGVNDASKGLESCEALKPDLILLDIMLPGNIDGFSFLRIIKKDKSLSHIPVIVMSALATHDKITEGLKLGANDYLIKPFDFAVLASLLVWSHTTPSDRVRYRTLRGNACLLETKGRKIMC